MKTTTENLKIDDSPTDMQQALAAFEQRYPGFAASRVLDELRRTDYARLDEQGHIYLDYTGGSTFLAGFSISPWKHSIQKGHSATILYSSPEISLPHFLHCMISRLL